MATVYSLICFGGRTGKTVTMTIANPCVVTLTNHGLRDGFGVVFSTSGASPTFTIVTPVTPNLLTVTTEENQGITTHLYPSLVTNNVIASSVPDVTIITAKNTQNTVVIINR